jgi:hypothetical protein
MVEQPILGAFKQTLIGYITGATNAYETLDDEIASMEMHFDFFV